MVSNSDNLQRFALYGAAVGLTSFVRAMDPEIEHLLGGFRVNHFPQGRLPISGTIWPYEQSHVLKHLSATARRVHNHSGAAELELYEEAERFWLVDDRWGIVEMNLLKGHWRTWLLKNPAMDLVRCAHFAILWPMAQLLRARGLYLVPAASVSFAQRSFLLIAPFGIEPELSQLIRGGYRVIGQSWTALREHDGRFEMLHLPGYVDRPVPFGMRLTGGDATPSWIDLIQDYPGSASGQGWCDGVVLLETGRREQADLRSLDRGAAGQLLRKAWPLFELHPNRRHGQLPARLAQKIPCYGLTLSRQPKDLLKVLSRIATPSAASVARPRGLRVAV